MQTISLTSSQKHYGRGNLELLLIDNEYGSAVVSLQGGQLLSYRRKRDQREFLWLSDDAIFEEGKAIRGGVPICLPWFGPKQGKPHTALLAVSYGSNETAKATLILTVPASILITAFVPI